MPSAGHWSSWWPCEWWSMASGGPSQGNGPGWGPWSSSPMATSMSGSGPDPAGGGSRPAPNSSRRPYTISDKWLSSLFLKTSSDGAPTYSGGRLFH
ncbi:Srst: Octapeptide-repeat protein T2 [Crotalus adamanteus]|uniref:Srst: Octapeptide-repeat protein T2 n=1 Tax=Crotalus adamanteus TaxID=8729 RepID=A0AAW1BF54_CROAD